MQETPVRFLKERSPGESIHYPLQCSWASLGAQSGKNLPVMWETCVLSLGWEGLLEGRIIPWRIPWTDELGRLQSMGVANSQTQLSIAHSFTLDDLAHFQNNVLIIPVILLF